jgi:surface antigen
VDDIFTSDIMKHALPRLLRRKNLVGSFLLVVLSLLIANFNPLLATTPVVADVGNNYPWANNADFPNCYVPKDVDTWGYCERYCTSWAAFALSDRNGFTMPRAIGSAYQWASYASNNGYTVNGTPAAGAVAQWNAYSWNGGFGHVAWVESVNGDGSIVVEEYNFIHAGGWDQRTVYPGGTGSNMMPNNFIHFDDLTPPPPPLPSEMPRYDLAWYDGTNLYNFEHFGYGTTYTTGPYSTPTWAGSGDYLFNGKPTEGVFWYLASNETLNFIPSPSFVGAYIVRSGIGPPVWAATGNFTGDGYRDSIAWYDGTNLYLFTGSGMGTTWYTSGYSAPTWAGVGDYNQDGKDDLFWYLGSSTTIYALTSTGSSFNGAAAVRGPGVGAPVWAGVGDFQGTHYRNDVAWYDGTTLWSLEGGSLSTTGSITGYSTPAWAGVGDCNNSNEDGLYWYLSSSTTLYCIATNGSSFGGATTLRGPGIGAPVWADSGDFDND